MHERDDQCGNSLKLEKQPSNTFDTFVVVVDYGVQHTVQHKHMWDEMLEEGQMLPIG